MSKSISSAIESLIASEEKVNLLKGNLSEAIAKLENCENSISLQGAQIEFLQQSISKHSRRHFK